MNSMARKCALRSYIKSTVRCLQRPARRPIGLFKRSHKPNNSNYEDLSVASDKDNAVQNDASDAAINAEGLQESNSDNAAAVELAAKPSVEEASPAELADQAQQAEIAEQAEPDELSEAAEQSEASELGEGAEQTDYAEPAEEDAQDTATSTNEDATNVEPENEETPTKLSAVARTKKLVASNVKVIAASAASLLLGFVGSMLLGGKEEVAQVVEEPVVEKPRYVAAVNRRNEPIGPLVPFEDLDPAVVDLGKRLFHDPGLSGNGRIACATCHIIPQGGDDGRQFPIGYENQVGNVNTPTVLNAAFNFVQFWDGRVESLEEQVDGPLLSEKEMNSDWERILKYVTTNERYHTAFTKHMGGEPNEDRVRLALATYERSLITPNSDFDQWLAGDEKALGGDEYGGYFLFKKMNCLGCHNGASVGGNSFQRLGALKDYFTSNSPAREKDLGRFAVTGDERDRYVFRVPSLRNVELTAPYLHDGSAKTLEEAVSIMIEHQVGLEAKPEDVRRIVAFLKSLTGEIPGE